MQSALTSFKRRTGAALLCLVLGALAALPAYAQWKWRDAQGNVQYSDRPPPAGTPDKDILQRPPGQEIRVVQWQDGKVVSSAASAPAVDPAAAAQAASEAKAVADAKRKAQELQAKQKAEDERIAAQRRTNCAQAQNNARMLASGQRIALPNAQGENIVLDDDARAAELQRVQGIIASECTQ